MIDAQQEPEERKPVLVATIVWGKGGMIIVYNKYNQVMCGILDLYIQVALTAYATKIQMSPILYITNFVSMTVVVVCIVRYLWRIQEVSRASGHGKWGEVTQAFACGALPVRQRPERLQDRSQYH